MPTALAMPWPSGPVVVSMPGAMAVLGVAGGAAAELAEALQLVERHVGVAGQMQQRIEQHRAVAGRQHEAVAVGPVGLGGIEFQELAEQHGRDVGHAHRHAGMAGFRLLDRVHGERADGVGHAAQMRVVWRVRGGGERDRSWRQLYLHCSGANARAHGSLTRLPIVCNRRPWARFAWRAMCPRVAANRGGPWRTSSSGSGDYKYRIIENWAKLPDGWSFKEVGAVGIDKNDNVYVFNRGEHPMMVFDRDGNFLRSWGEGQYPRAHGVHMGPDDIDLSDRRRRQFRAQVHGSRTARCC